jgi:hypothetical protein
VKTKPWLPPATVSLVSRSISAPAASKPMPAAANSAVSDSPSTAIVCGPTFTPATVSSTIGPMNFSTASARTRPISSSRLSSEMTAPGTPEASTSKPVKVTWGATSSTWKRPPATSTAIVPRRRAVVARIVMFELPRTHAAA